MIWLEAQYRSTAAFARVPLSPKAVYRKHKSILESNEKQLAKQSTAETISNEGRNIASIAATAGRVKSRRMAVAPYRLLPASARMTRRDALAPASPSTDVSRSHLPSTPNRVTDRFLPSLLTFMPYPESSHQRNTVRRSQISSITSIPKQGSPACPSSQCWIHRRSIDDNETSQLSAQSFASTRSISPRYPASTEYGNCTAELRHTARAKEEDLLEIDCCDGEPRWEDEEDCDW